MVPDEIFNSSKYRKRVSLFTYFENIVKLSLSNLHGQILSSGDLILLKDRTVVMSYETIYQYGALKTNIYAYSPYEKKGIDVSAENIIGIVQKEDVDDYAILKKGW
jgi:hypothetical protein